MRPSFRGLLAFSVFFTAIAAPFAARADTASAEPGKAADCLYRDAHYGNGAVICVAPQYGQRCTNGVWSTPIHDEGFDKMCAGAQIAVPGVPAAQCLYHDFKYAPGAMICVAPHIGLTCNPDGGWVPAANVERACANAQIPNPATQPASK
jgi:hypothetical protein